MASSPYLALYRPPIAWRGHDGPVSTQQGLSWHTKLIEDAADEQLNIGVMAVMAPHTMAAVELAGAALVAMGAGDAMVLGLLDARALEQLHASLHEGELRIKQAACGRKETEETENAFAVLYHPARHASLSVAVLGAANVFEAMTRVARDLKCQGMPEAVLMGGFDQEAIDRLHELMAWVLRHGQLANIDQSLP